MRIAISVKGVVEGLLSLVVFIFLEVSNLLANCICGWENSRQLSYRSLYSVSKGRPSAGSLFILIATTQIHHPSVNNHGILVTHHISIDMPPQVYMNQRTEQKPREV